MKAYHYEPIQTGKGALMRGSKMSKGKKAASPKIDEEEITKEVE